MSGNNSFKVKWWEVSLRMQGGKKEVREELSSSDANAATPSLPIAPGDGALSTSCSTKKTS